MNMRAEDVNLGNVILGDAVHRDYALTFAGAGTMVSGTILKVVAEKLLPYVKGDTDPVTVLTYDVTADAAGDVQVRAMVSGRVRKELLVIDADGDASNVDNSVIDQLRNFGLVTADVTELNIPDNQ